MDRNTALAHLGLRGNEDSADALRLANRRLASTRSRLSGARNDVERIECERELSLLAEALDRVTAVVSNVGPGTSKVASISAATIVREPANHVARIAPGDLLGGRIEVGELLGSGGMGTVYAARDRLKQEDIAIKVLRQDLLSNQSAGKRFLAEAKLSCSLAHPNIVRVHDIGASSNQYYFSMERLRGRTLRQRMIDYRYAKRQFSVAEVTDIAKQLIDALRYAHRHLVHQDIKPENIWLTDDGTVKLMDFGIARTYSEFRSTRYVAPEHQPVRDRVDWRVDQFSLAIVLYELLTGTLPVGQLAPLQKVRRDVSIRCAKAITRAMSLTPDDRWTSLDEMLAELEAPAARSALATAAVLTGALLFAAAAGAVAYYGGLPPLLASQSGVVSETAPASLAAKPDSTLAATVSAATPTAHLSRPPREGSPASSSVNVKGKASYKTSGENEPQANAAAPTDTSLTAQCINQCERDQGECRSISRRGKQQCLQATAFNASGNRITSSVTNRALADCAFYARSRCEYARDSSSCLRRMHVRYEECAAAYGNIAQRSQDCGDTANDAEHRCLTELRDCRAACQ